MIKMMMVMVMVMVSHHPDGCSPTHSHHEQNECVADDGVCGKHLQKEEVHSE